MKQYAGTSGSAVKTAALVSDTVLDLQAYGRQVSWNDVVGTLL